MTDSILNAPMSSDPPSSSLSVSDAVELMSRAATDNQKGNTTMSTMKTGPITVDSPIEFGKIYRDTITGFTGKAIGLTAWVTGCDCIGLTSGIDKDGKIQDAEWFDDGRLELVETGARMPSSGHGAAGADPVGR